MKNFLLGLSKFVLGIILAMLIMSLAGAAMVRYFMARSGEPPERPIYDNDLPEDQPVAAAPEGSDSPEVSALEESAAAEIENAPEPEPEADPEPDPEPAPEGGYDAYVTQPVGLILRSGPGVDYTNIGGIGYEERITVLGEEAGWLNVLLSNGEEGWIREGNTAPE
ncbi:MAG: SH3 domain-containing protein [Phormidesmis sp.]